MSIPCKLHQTWKTHDVPVLFRNYIASWKQHGDHFEYNMYTDQQLRDLIHQHYPQFSGLYDNFRHLIERVDFARYAIMHKSGGVYADMDMELVRELPESWFDLLFTEKSEKPDETSYSSGSNEKNSSDEDKSEKSDESSKSSKSVESDKSDDTKSYTSKNNESSEHSYRSKYKIIIGQEPLEHARNIYGRDMVLCNAIMMSVPGHPFWLNLMNFIASNYNRNGSPVHNTGPMAMTLMYERNRDHFDDVKIMPACTFYSLTNNNTSIHKGRHKSISAECVDAIDNAYTVHHWTNTWIAPYDGTKTFKIQELYPNVPQHTHSTHLIHVTNNKQLDESSSEIEYHDHHNEHNHRRNLLWKIIVGILILLIIIGLIMWFVMYVMRKR